METVTLLFEIWQPDFFLTLKARRRKGGGEGREGRDRGDGIWRNGGRRDVTAIKLLANQVITWVIQGPNLIACALGAQRRVLSEHAQWEVLEIKVLWWERDLLLVWVFMCVRQAISWVAEMMPAPYLSNNNVKEEKDKLREVTLLFAIRFHAIVQWQNSLIYWITEEDFPYLFIGSWASCQHFTICLYVKESSNL